MASVATFAGTVYRVYERSMLVVGGAMLASMVLVMGVQVYYRYVLNDSLIWAEELARYLLVWISFLFLGIGFQRGELIAVDFFRERIPRAWSLLLLVLGYTIAIAFLLVLAWYGFKFAEVNGLQTLPAFDFIWSALSGDGAALNVSAWWIYASVPIGALLLAAHMAVTMVLRVSGRGG